MSIVTASSGSSSVLNWLSSNAAGMYRCIRTSNLLRITSSDDLYAHYLRGGLFESMIISNLLKNRYHHALPPNAYFWRDKMGNEVDCILEEGSKTEAIEIKSSETLNTAMFDGLNKWSQLAKASSRRLIYAGDENQERKDVLITSWNSI